MSDAGAVDAGSGGQQASSSHADAGRVDTGSAESSKNDAGQPDTSSMMMQSCGDLMCKSPATCQRDGDKPHCVCPDGYDDKNGDGSECVDKDECAKPGDNNCDKHAKCENTPGSYKCTCDGPAYTGDGKQCDCADGYMKQDNLCLAKDGGKCSDNLDCMNGHCESGICCAQACTAPPSDCSTRDGATCEDGHTCKYPNAKDGTACDDGDACTTDGACKAGSCQHGTKPTNCDDGNPCTDDSCDSTIGCKNKNNTAKCDDGNPCTLNDVCANGTCAGPDHPDCSAQNDACNTGVCDAKSGNCVKKPVADGMKCDDANSCTKTDQCSGGACKGDGDACGPNATNCMPGMPNTCQCASNFKPLGGLCVPMNDECEANPAPCSPNADCFDPSNDPNTVMCTCKAGYTGDGKTCVPLDPCKDNPCGDGRGTCTAGPQGSGMYTCACNAGYMEVAGQCVCDMNGTFANRSEMDLSWPAADSIEAGSGTSIAWGIQRQHYDAQGNLEIESVPCGENTVDLCGTGLGVLVPAEAYVQYSPAKNFDGTAAPLTQTMSLLAPLPKAPFSTQLSAAIGGIELSDPLGAWPTSRKDVQGGPEYGGTAVNGARWIDADNDGVIGVTTYAVGPNGAAADGSATAPLFAFGTHSMVCPRGNASANRLPYNYPPAAENLTVRRVKRFFSANRTISQLTGQFDSCDRISGSIGGPDNGAPHFDERIGGCVRVNGSGEAACSPTVLDFLDVNNQSMQTVTGTRFVVKRVADNITCEQVRALDFSQ